MSLRAVAALQHPDELANGLQAERNQISALQSLDSYPMLRRIIVQDRAQQHVGVDSNLHAWPGPPAAPASMMASLIS